MKNLVISILLVALGVAGTYVYYTRSSAPVDPHAGHNHAPGEHPGEEAAHNGVAWCNEHDVAEADCPFCNPDLIESKGMCNGHGVPEALCTRCNASLIPAFKAENDWCAGHNLPESQCLECNPGLKQSAAPEVEEIEVVVAPAPESAGFLPRSLQPSDVYCAKESVQIRLLSPEVAGRLGLVAERVATGTAPHTIRTTATVIYDENRHAKVAPRLSGILRSVKKDLGDLVDEGEVVAVIDSLELGHAKSACLEARALLVPARQNLKREESLLKQGITTEESVLAARSRAVELEVVLSRAEQTLRNLGFSEAQVEEIARKSDRSPLLSVTAPLAGVVVERDAVIGESVDAGRALFAVADTTTMWAMLQISEADLGMVSLGLPVLLEVNGLSGVRFGGTVDWISTAIDVHTRTLPVRARIDNPRGHLRAGMLGRAELTLGDRELSVLVPKAAVQWEGCCNVVFVQASEQLYQPHKVDLAYESGDYYVVRGGVSSGDPVVTHGSFLLKTELLKENIGAGCCESAPGL